jgi:Ni/Fe-hydrogenase subunit HybB-like protein
MVHGELWTLKELFVLPNEYVYWSIQIVMYPFMTGLVAGAFVLSSLYHVFGIKRLEGMARFALVFSLALLPGAIVPLMLHLQHPARGFEVMWTPHFTSAIAAFGIVFAVYAAILCSEIWFVYRGYFVERVQSLRNSPSKSVGQKVLLFIYVILTLGAFDLSEKARSRDRKATKVLAAVGIPVALFLHGYAGFIFGSVKANALWLTPLMPVIFIMSAIVSGIALCMLTYIVTMQIRKLRAKRGKSALPADMTPEEMQSSEISVIKTTGKYLLYFLIFAISLELLDLVFRGYTSVKSWDVLRTVIYDRDSINIFLLQYGLGNLVPLILFLLPRLTIKRAVVGLLLVLFGVFMMRYNVVIGGQAFSLTFAGYMEYAMPLAPRSWETFREGLFGAIMVFVIPFILFYVFSRILPVFQRKKSG